MTEPAWRRMLDHARPFLEAAQENAARGPERAAVAYDEARHAAELASKALFLRATGRALEKTHRVGGPLGRNGLLPAAFPEREWNRFFANHTKAAYGFYEDFDEADVRTAVRMAGAMLSAAQSYPDFAFHPPRTD